MSEVGVAYTPIVRDRQEENDSRSCMDKGDSQIALADTFLVNYHQPFDDYVAESWLPLPQAFPSWNNVDPRDQWSPDASMVSKPFGFSVPREEQDNILYDQNTLSPQSPINAPDYELSRPHTEHSHEFQPPINQMPQHYGDAYLSQPPHTTTSQPSYAIYGTTSFQIQATDYPLPHEYKYGVEFIHEQSTQSWSPPTPEAQWPKSNTDDDPQPVKQPPNRLPLGLILDWSVCDQSSAPSTDGMDSPTTGPTPKRKTSKESVAKSSYSETPPLSQCVDVFENAPGALANVKRRKKLDAPVRKAAREVRKAGACHQCRFRKRTCSTGTPCGSCLKNSNGLHEIKCQRESPFIGKMTHEYFEHSSTRRVVRFNFKIPFDSDDTYTQEMVTIDGVGRISHTLTLPARRRVLGDLAADVQAIIMKTEDSKQATDQQGSLILLLEEDEALGTQVEQWALEYTSKFVHAAGPQFYSTTIAQILGTVYVKKGLPESDLVGAMLRVAALSFVLRAGVNFTTTGPKLSSRFRTIQAKIDTILYRRLQLAENHLYQRLQRLIFRSAGCLTKEQIYPVALVLWQLLRFCCIASSHLANIAQRFHSQASGPAEYQYHGMKLVLSTHLALFRSSNPLLLDMDDKFNQKLVGNDPKLIELAREMRKVVLTLKEKGLKELKGSITYRKEYFDMFRKVYASK